MTTPPRVISRDQGNKQVSFLPTERIFYPGDLHPDIYYEHYFGPSGPCGTVPCPVGPTGETGPTGATGGVYVPPEYDLPNEFYRPI